VCVCMFAHCIFFQQVRPLPEGRLCDSESTFPHETILYAHCHMSVPWLRLSLLLTTEARVCAHVGFVVVKVAMEQVF
jgi:hypothetical protein